MTSDPDRDDREGLAAEYVLGTLDPDERAQAQTLVAVDPDFADMIRKWERRLGELNVLIAPMEPPPDTWERIKAAVEAPAAGEPRLPDGGIVPLPHADHAGAGAEIIGVRRSLRGWRRAALSITTLAAALAAVVVLREARPDLVPARLRPKPNVQVVEVTRTVEVPSPKPAQYVAILQKDTSSPAFLLTFDLDRRVLTVRTVGAERRADKSYELWLISDKFPAPRSLGVIGNSEFTVRPQLAAYDAVTINSATYAVSIEPTGGSPTGRPTGPVVYTGRLIQATPPGFGSQTP